MQQEHSIKIFAVDSNLFSLMILQQQLRNLHYINITVFDSSTTCIAHLGEKPNVVIVHQRIKPNTGIELLQIIKKFDPCIYVIFVASINDVQIAMDSLKSGAFDYILKGANAVNRIDHVLVRIQNTEAYILGAKRDYHNWSQILN